MIGCSPNIKDYKGEKPQLDIFEYFSGKTKAHGIIKDWKGKVTRSFTVTMSGRVENDKLILDEDFVFSDGEKQNRVWTFTRTGENTFEGTAKDVIGKAEGKQYGNAMNMNYVLRVPRGGGTIDIKIDDWMYLISEKSLFNLSKFYKFGIQVGELSIYFEKIE